MTRYTATITHHTIVSPERVPVGDTLAAAKRNATREFGGGYHGHLIRIYDTRSHPDPVFQECVAERLMQNPRWQVHAPA